VSRAAFNKICLEYFEEGMRKPARNGNPGSLESDLAVQRRHFLRGRWRDPAVSVDMVALKNLWSTMTAEQESASYAMLKDFSRWKPGPAGRGGERLSRKRGSEDGESDRDMDNGDSHSAYAGGEWDPHPGMPMGNMSSMDAQQHQDMGVPPPRKRASTREMHMKRQMQGGRMDGPGPLELLCNVAFNSDQMHPGAMGPEHLPIHSMHHDVDLAADRMVKGDMSNGWHQHHLGVGGEMGPTNLPDDDGALADEHCGARHRHHPYHPHPHVHPAMHRMSTMGMEYEHARAAHLHRHLDMYGGPHMGGSHRMDDRARDMRGDMLMPHSGYAPPHLKGAWDSPSAQYDLRVGGLPPTSGHMPLHHRSPRHGPMPPPGKSPQHGPKRSPHHGPMRPPPHGGIPNTKSPRHSPMPGHSNEMRGEMLPPSSNGAWLKSPGLSHMKPKKIPGRFVRVRATAHAHVVVQSDVSELLICILRVSIAAAFPVA
jgi:hypothetical protein